jgi:superkiller protein 3
MSTQSADELLQQLSELLEWHNLGTGALTPRPRGGRLHGEDAAAMAELLDQLAAADEGLPAGRSPRSLVFGNGCFAIGRYAEALVVYQALAGLQPSDFSVHFNLGVTCLRRRQPDDACRALTTALEIDDSHASAYYQRGNARDDMGDADGALDDYAAAIRLDPEYLQAYYNRGIVLTNLGRYREAVGAFDEALALNPDISNAYLNRGVAWEELGDADAAVADFDRALQRNPDNADARFNKARTCYRLGRYREAIVDYSAAIELRPEDVEAINNRGLAYDAVGQYQDAVADYDTALELRPDFAEVLSNRGAAQETLGNLDEALADYLAAQEALPTFAAAYYNAARLYADRADIERCAQQLAEAVRLQPGLYAEAESDEMLGWVLDLTRMRDNRQSS